MLLGGAPPRPRRLRPRLVRERCQPRRCLPLPSGARRRPGVRRRAGPHDRSSGLVRRSDLLHRRHAPDPSIGRPTVRVSAVSAPAAQSAYERLVACFGGQPPQVQCWSPTEYRVTYHRWHLHDGASTSAPFADGKSLEAACESLLRQIDQAHVELVEGDCDWQCEARYSGSPKAKLAHGLLLKILEESAATVARRPAWKRGLPPCANCDLAAGHPPPCDPVGSRAPRTS